MQNTEPLPGITRDPLPETAQYMFALISDRVCGILEPDTSHESRRVYWHSGANLDGGYIVSQDKLICVRTCFGLDVAQIYKIKLEANGIPVLLKYESAGRVYGITVDSLGQVRIMVPEPYADEATELLTDFGDDELTDDWNAEEPPTDPSPDL
jgi:hypothetical protein